MFFANLLLVSERKNTLENSARMIIVDAEAGTAASWERGRKLQSFFYLEREVGVVEVDQPEYQHEGDVDKEEELNPLCVATMKRGSISARLNNAF